MKNKTWKQTPLHIAAKSGKVKIVEMLIDYHINSWFFKNVKLDKEIKLNEQDSEGMTPLMRCIVECSQKEQCTEIVKLLVSNDCNVNIADERGNTALFYALQEMKDDIAVFLILYEADINWKNKEGLTPLSFANHKLKTSTCIELSEIVQKSKEEEKLKKTSVIQ